MRHYILKQAKAPNTTNTSISYPKPTDLLSSGRILGMLKERKIYLTLRELEKGSTGGGPVKLQYLIDSVLAKNTNWLFWMKFKDASEVRRIFQSLVPQSALHDPISDGRSMIDAVRTVASSDTRFSNPYFWNKWIDEVGIKRIFAVLTFAIFLVEGFLPNGVGWKLISLLNTIIGKL